MRGRSPGPRSARRPDLCRVAPRFSKASPASAANGSAVSRQTIAGEPLGKITADLGDVEFVSRSPRTRSAARRHSSTLAPAPALASKSAPKRSAYACWKGGIQPGGRLECQGDQADSPFLKVRVVDAAFEKLQHRLASSMRPRSLATATNFGPLPAIQFARQDPRANRAARGLPARAHLTYRGKSSVAFVGA
jgi:hypothetical protein